MKIFVTGCAGLLGANYSRHLLANGHQVIGIDDLSGGHKAFIPKGENFQFVNDYDGLYEYAIENKLPFWDDNLHIQWDGHKIYFNNVIKKRILEII